jgi:hypothetical protein
MEATIKHYLDPLHIYCRLRNLGLTKGPISSARLQVPFGIKIEIVKELLLKKLWYDL